MIRDENTHIHTFILQINFFNKLKLMNMKLIQAMKCAADHGSLFVIKLNQDKSHVLIYTASNKNL